MNFSDSRSFGWARKIHLRPGLAFAIIILIALALARLIGTEHA